MPICDSHNNLSKKLPATDVKRQYDIAKTKITSEQAYFNSYDFDAIEIVSLDENETDNADEIDDRRPSYCFDSRRKHSFSDSDDRCSVLGLTDHRQVPSGTHLERLTSYFSNAASTKVATATKVFRLKKPSSKSFVPTTVGGDISCEISLDNRSGHSSSSQDPSRKLCNAGSRDDVNRASRKGTFSLPRAMLKCQIALVTSSMSTTDAPSAKSPSKMCNCGSLYTTEKRSAGRSDSSLAQCCEKLNGHERVISSSNYSTDKSGSSGYYSSRVCSTSSVEDHIYSEPVIDIVQTTLVPLKQLTGPLQKSLEKHTQGRHQSDVIRNFPSGESFYVSNSHGKIKDGLLSLETSIKNLDKHLKDYPAPAISSSIRCGTLVYDEVPSSVQILEKPKTSRPMPTIMEGVDAVGVHQISLKKPPDWTEEMDDSLMDIDLDSFLLANEVGLRKPGKVKAKKKEMLAGIDNPNFDEAGVLNEEVLENNYRCSKYVNSCPEDAYKVESVIEPLTHGCGNRNACSTQKNSLGFFLKRYEDQLHFQSTKDLLEDIRNKVNALTSLSGLTDGSDADGYHPQEIPRDVEKYIAVLKKDLEAYLKLMNQCNEMEIKQFCTGLVNNQRLMAITKAFERRQSSASDNNSLSYEAIRRLPSFNMSTMDNKPQMDMSRCCDEVTIACSDPNFKLKRKPLIGRNDSCNAQHSVIRTNKIEAEVRTSDSAIDSGNVNANAIPITQLQRNLSLQRPRLDRKSCEHYENDKESILMDWHKNKPSIWEQYYGTNRINQTLTGKRGQLVKNGSSILSYPSSRPESDFTLDLPRAEQLRIKMDKEKKFRHRCRILTTILSLVFFILTVMVVSLILTRGKRMFGSML